MFRSVPLLKALSILYFISFVLLSIPNYSLSAETNKWDKVASNTSEIQYISPESIKYKKGILSLITQHVEVNPDTNDVISTNSYAISIDCQNRLFKMDKSTKWEKPNEILMKNTVIKSCTY